MTTYRVMTWNIQTLSTNKLAIAGVGTAIARTVVAQDIDLLLVLEVRLANVVDTMTKLARELHDAEVAHRRAAKKPVPKDCWLTPFLSHQTGTERYCAFVRDLDAVRPVAPTSSDAVGTEVTPLADLTAQAFQVWPSFDWAKSTSTTGPPTFPVVEAFATATRRDVVFPGREYAQGLGFRLPALMMFLFRGGTATRKHLIPFVACHYGAVRNADVRNQLANHQLLASTWLHIAQMFTPPHPGPNHQGDSRHIMIATDNGQEPVPVQDLCFTGDYNLDFLKNDEVGPEGKRKYQYHWLTPTKAAGGSGTPAATGTTAGPPYPPKPYPPKPPLSRPDRERVRKQELRAAITRKGTILHFPADFKSAAAGYASHCFDNFFYGGQVLHKAALDADGDAGRVVVVPDNVVRSGSAKKDATEQLDLTEAGRHHVKARTKDAVDPAARGLYTPARTLGDKGKLIGARLLSDHLPVVLQFDLK
ncbi:hypothetical protein AB0A74_05310 [Saccharothrix sp. NPDC042600]|uniref:hypothetical protein n=1 Tax=Saccharothrix TaxID=2071 RepID=UPI0033C4A8B5|nr:hypothetical protein GCM10017745_37180 [Saccharothrix mutabilis subsp. capreolus]